MNAPQPDDRTADRRDRDEQIAAEPPLPPPDVPANAIGTPVESHRNRPRSQPRAIVGIVENGIVRPVDPEVTLPERSRVIIVAGDAG